MSRLGLPLTMIVWMVVPGLQAKDPIAPWQGKGPEALSARIDERIAAGWQAKGVKPAPVTEDAEFFRRLSLDLNGRIPTITTMADFLDDRRPDKRRIWIDKLILGRDPAFPQANYPEFPKLYAEHFGSYWYDYLFARAIDSTSNNGFSQHDAGSLQDWFQGHIRQNTPYDKLVHELLTVRGDFYSLNQFRPETLAAETSRLFLGVKLECAQCHDDRSGGDWSREQFWQFAAFFVEVSVQNKRPTQVPQIKIPDHANTVPATFLDGYKHEWSQDRLAHHVLADWLVRRENPYFARAVVNHMWSYFFGIGLVDPIDVMGTKENPPSHPELLDELTAAFVAHDFDLQYLIRAIAGSKTYQRSSVRSDPSQDDPRLFARMPVRGMTPEQLLKSLHIAVGATYRRPHHDPYRNAQHPDDITQFLAKFRNPHDRRIETKTSILQALYMMNSSFLLDLMHTPNGSLDIVQTAGNRIPTARQVKDLYLVTLSRRPRAEETERLVKYIESGGPRKDRKRALEDVFWALLNSTEFCLNH
ncbi:MAG: DUF1553 domain-containing protein [Gemmataceae bacterium]